MFREVEIGIATDGMGRRVARMDRYSVEVDLGHEGRYRVGIDPEPEAIVVLSGEVRQIEANGFERPVKSPDVDVVLEVAREGLSALSSRQIVIAR